MVALRPPFRAEDMEGLYRKVLRGQYPRIPPHYSQDLSEVIACLLQVNPRHRPSIDQLLQMPVMRRHCSAGDVYDINARPNDLLQTIKLPKNSIDLSFCLPKPRYEPERKPAYELDRLGSHDEAPSERGGDIAGGGMRRENRASQRSEMLGQGYPSMPMESPAQQRVQQEASDKHQQEPQDSLDAYLQGAAPQHESYSVPSPGAVDTAARHHPPPVPDTLDAYLQQQNRLPPLANQRGGRHSEDASIHDDRHHHQPPPPSHLSGVGPPQQPRNRHMRPADVVADYGGANAGGRVPNYRQAADGAYHRGSSPAVPVQRYDHGVSDAARGSPAPSSAAQRARAQLYGGHAPQEYRQPRAERRQMANYTRPQYELNNAPAQAPKQSGGAGLRLPRIFSKGS
eukprot:gnl/TRDRNA2_/TRDRNA2_138038_c1_seq1.p1 gnl/TRDRNA2_/TRDRNA2_138038_c1~~gnl/TRDRNA2_/TRDRNA2_138038_c1_seq1.p1  ORF type:complete len:462 (+),score=75.61 gnl/TRDRNA2_/TRDRNA2_138038_c1_seq1:194-1387(+)